MVTSDHGHILTVDCYEYYCDYNASLKRIKLNILNVYVCIIVLRADQMYLHAHGWQRTKVGKGNLKVQGCQGTKMSHIGKGYLNVQGWLRLHKGRRVEKDT